MVCSVQTLYTYLYTVAYIAWSLWRKRQVFNNYVIW